MLKEMFFSVDKSFHSHVGEIKSPETALDAMKIGTMIIDSSYSCGVPNYGLPDCNLIMQSEMIKKEEERKLEEHKNEPDYVENLRDICNWFKEGIFESGKTRGQKLRYLEKRSNLNSFLGEE